jgi:hypothetical protein
MRQALAMVEHLVLCLHAATILLQWKLRRVYRLVGSILLRNWLRFNLASPRTACLVAPKDGQNRQCLSTDPVGMKPSIHHSSEKYRKGAPSRLESACRIAG